MAEYKYENECSNEYIYILKYIANIISVDTLEIDSNYQSPLIKKLIEKNKEAIIKLAEYYNIYPEDPVAFFTTS